jgi:glucose-1-phosphate thymidylyltransferase
VTIVGVIPAAGYGTRLQPLSRSKEVLPVRGKPVMDHLVERMRVGGCTRLRVVTRPDKEDVITHAASLGAEVVLGRPETVSRSFLVGMDGLDGGDLVLIGFPDSIWEPMDGFRPLVAAVREGCEVALGLFRLPQHELTRSDVVVRGEAGRIEGIDVKPDAPASDWIWGCAAARARTWSGLVDFEWPGGFVDFLCRQGADVRGVELSDSWIDVGTPEALERVHSFARDP